MLIICDDFFFLIVLACTCVCSTRRTDASILFYSLYFQLGAEVLLSAAYEITHQQNSPDQQWSSRTAVDPWHTTLFQFKSVEWKKLPGNRKSFGKGEKKTFPQKRDFFLGLFGADLTHKFDLYPSLKRRWQQSPCWWALRSGGERGLHSAGWRAAAVRGSGGGPGEAAGARVGPRTWTPGLRPSHRNGPAHRTGDRMREKSAKSPRYFFALNKYKYIYKKNKYTQACCVVRCCCCCWWRRARGEKNKNC